MTFDAKGFDGWRFDPNDNRKLTAPRAAPDGPAAPSTSATAIIGGMAMLGMLGVFEGTLAWIALRWAADLGWLATPPEWLPVVGLALAVTFLRGIDRAVFTRQ